MVRLLFSGPAVTVAARIGGKYTKRLPPRQAKKRLFPLPGGRSGRAAPPEAVGYSALSGAAQKRSASEVRTPVAVCWNPLYPGGTSAMMRPSVCVPFSRS